MAAQALPPPSAGGAGGQAAPTPPQDGPSPAPAQPGALQTLGLVRNIVSSARMLGKQNPSTVPVVQQILELAQQLQVEIIKSGPPQEPMAPPV